MKKTAREVDQTNKNLRNLGKKFRRNAVNRASHEKSRDRDNKSKGGSKQAQGAENRAAEKVVQKGTDSHPGRYCAGVRFMKVAK